MEKSFDFVGLGFCSNDYLCILPYIPLDNKVKIIKRLIQGGGPAGNSTVAASKLGLRAAFVSAIGDDSDGKKMLEDFEAEKVCTRGIKVRKGCESPLAYCWIDEPTGARSVAWTRGNTPELEADEVDLSLLEGAKILHIDGHNPKGALAAAKRAKELGGSRELRRRHRPRRRGRAPAVCRPLHRFEAFAALGRRRRISKRRSRSSRIRR